MVNFRFIKNIYLKHQTQPETNYTWISDVKWDDVSADPHFIDYNTMRKRIRTADKDGLKKIVDRMSSAVWERLEWDGYTIRLATEEEKIPQPDGFPLIHVVEWERFMPSKRVKKENPDDTGLMWREILIRDCDVVKYLNMLTDEEYLENNEIRLVKKNDGMTTIYYYNDIKIKSIK